MAKYYTLIIFLLLNFQHLHSQDTSKFVKNYDLQEVEITYQADKLTPITFKNISARKLKFKSTGQEPSFILSESPSITNYSDAGNAQGYSYFRVRGIDQTRINITLDGVPLNEPEDQGAYFSNYPDLLNSVRKIQIQRGVGTSKNGMASYGGSVQMFSPNLNDSTQTTFGLGYGSFNSFRAFGEYKSGVKNKKSFYVRASQINSDGYKYNSSNNSQSIFVSSSLFNDKSIWKLNLLAGQQQNEMAWLGVLDSLINIDRRTNFNSDQEDDKFFQSLMQLQNIWQINQSSSLQSSIYYTYLKGNYDFDFNNFLGFPSTDELFNYAFQSNLIGLFSNYSYSKNSLVWTTGIHGNIYNRKHTGSEKSLGELYQNTGFKNEASIFTKADYTFKSLNLYADMQYRYVYFSYEGSVQLDKLVWHFLNPKAGLSYSVAPNSIVYYSVGSTGREPTRNDMFGGNDDLLEISPGVPLLFNTESESVLNHEIGFRHHKNNLNFNLNLYYMDFENEITLDGRFGPNGLALTNNVEQSIRLGIELDLKYTLNEHFALINNSSFNYSRITEQNEKFSPILTPPVIINQEILYTNKSFSCSLSARFQDESYIDFANSSTLDNYFLLNSRVSYGFHKFHLSLYLNNITNSKYFNNGFVDFDGSKKYFVQSPTNFNLMVQYKL